MDRQDIAIRPFAAADTGVLSAIWFAASVRAHPFIGQTRLREEKVLIEQEYLPGAETWVATVNGEAAGFVSLIDNFVGGLFVCPTRQRLGIGRRLVAHALDLRGELSLEVYTDNAQAMRFYRAMGFQELSRCPRDDEGYPYENARLHLVR